MSGRLDLAIQIEQGPMVRLQKLTNTSQRERQFPEGVELLVASASASCMVRNGGSGVSDGGP